VPVCIGPVFARNRPECLPQHRDHVGRRAARLRNDVGQRVGPAADMVAVLGQAFGTIAREDWANADRHLTTAMGDHARIGGSRAQRDLIEYAQAGVLLRLGQADTARRLLAMHRPRTATNGVIAGL
jgi:hypothetical protein